MADTGVFCTGTECGYKAGAGKSTVSSAEAYTNSFIAQNEGYINSICKYDFTTNYATINAICKAILKRWCTALTAKDIAAYDGSGYPSTVKWQTLLNVLADEAKECEAFMLKTDIKRFAETGNLS